MAKKIIISLSIGIIAGIVDVIPMIFQGLDWYSNVSAFVFWIVTSFIIAYTVLPMQNWLKGLIEDLRKTSNFMR